MLAVDFSNTFDTTNALSGMYLWVLFSYLAALLNCDLQRWLKTHPLMIHTVGLVSFFFLFTLIDSSNKTSVLNILIKTFFIYVLFVLITKSKWYFVLPVLALLLIDQAMKKDIAYKKQQAIDNSVEEEQATTLQQQEATIKHYSSILNNVIIGLIIIGTIHYVYLQRIEYKNKFSFYKFFLGFTTCKSKMPNYQKLRRA